jgi:hypothetical protein
MRPPELLGPQPWDGPQHKKSRGRARMHEGGQDPERAARSVVHPLEKMKLVWSDGYRGGSGTESLKGV